MSPDETPSDPAPDATITCKIPLSKADWAFLEAAAHKEGCSPAELFQRAGMQALDHFEETCAHFTRQAVMKDALKDFLRRITEISCRTESLADDLEVGGRPPTDAEIAAVVRDLEDIVAYKQRLADFFFPPSGQGRLPPLPPAGDQ